MREREKQRERKRKNKRERDNKRARDKKQAGENTGLMPGSLMRSLHHLNIMYRC